MYKSFDKIFGFVTTLRLPFRASLIPAFIIVFMQGKWMVMLTDSPCFLLCRVRFHRLQQQAKGKFICCNSKSNSSLLRLQILTN